MKPIYLPINRKCKDFQLVHLDALNGYGIAFKFNFSNSQNTFTIEDAKMILASKNPIEYKIKITNKFRPSNEIGFGFEINLEITGDNYSENQFPQTDLEIGENYKIASMDNRGYLKKEHLIDVHIENKKAISTIKNMTGLAVDFGTEFCKFYII